MLYFIDTNTILTQLNSKIAYATSVEHAPVERKIAAIKGMIKEADELLDNLDEFGTPVDQASAAVAAE